MQTAYFAGGCFWCVEAIFQRVNGVKELANGYCNGSTKNPTYEEVCGGQSGHAEVLKIEFDEQQISFADLLEVFVGILLIKLMAVSDEVPCQRLASIVSVTASNTPGS